MRDLYVRIFLFTGIPFGLIMGFGGTFSTGNPTSGFLGGLVFGVTMTLITGSMHIILIESAGYEISKENLSVEQSREVKLDLPFEQAFKLCLDSLDVINQSMVLTNDIGNGRIVARTLINWKTLGDIVEFNIERDDGESTTVRLTSRPLLKISLVDYGKNLDNVEKISSFLREKTGAGQTAKGRIPAKQIQSSNSLE